MARCSPNIDEIMETQSAFNLSEALDDWRIVLKSHSLGTQEVQELESHLLETMESLKSAKLSPAEAFLVARHRVGKPEILSEQYRLVEPMNVWKQRGIWMLIGVLLFWTAGAVANLSSLFTLIVGHRWTNDGFILGFFGLAVQAIILASGGLLLWRGVQSRYFLAPRMATLTKWFMGVLIGTVILRFCNLIISSWAATTSSPRTLGGFYMIASGYSGPLMILGFGVLGGWLCWNLRREQVVCCVALCGSLLLGACGPKGSQAPPAHSSSTQASATSNTRLETAFHLANENPAKAADEFMRIDLAEASLFSPGSPLSYSETQFMKLPREANEKLARQAQDDLALIKKMVAEIKTRRDQSRAAGNAEMVRQFNSQLEKFASKLEEPGNLAITQLVGKAVRKVAAQ